MDTSFTIEDAKSLDPSFEAIEKDTISETVFPASKYFVLKIFSHFSIIE